GGPRAPWWTRRIVLGERAEQIESKHTPPTVREVASREGAVAVQTTGLAKSFGATQALRNCSLTLRAGEIHAIMGENGSGKSTLVKILSGVYPPDRGAFAILSGSVDTPSSPSAALAAGICTVFQEVLVAGQRSVLANVWLGTDGLFKQRRSPAAKRTRTREVLGQLLGDVPDLDGPVERLSLSGRQACCIA